MYLWSGKTTVKSAADTTGVSQKITVHARCLQHQATEHPTRFRRTRSRCANRRVYLPTNLNTKEADDQTKKHGSSGFPTHPPNRQLRTCIL